MDIKEIKKDQLSDIYEFLNVIDEYGHIYHYPPERLDAPFEKIIEGINEIHELMKDSFEM